MSRPVWFHFGKSVMPHISHLEGLVFLHMYFTSIFTCILHMYQTIVVLSTFLSSKLLPGTVET